IYDTRPWKIFGEGPATDNINTKKNSGGQQFNENSRKLLTEEDIRFTTKGNVLYAFFMGWPASKEVNIKALGTNSSYKTGTIENIDLLGYGKVSFTRDDQSLKINVPDVIPGHHAYALKISGQNLF
ncbi:MAG: alpha-L-fucosidase C-terminal domain-containing protein, partial [Flavisolibacter sp.]